MQISRPYHILPLLLGFGIGASTPRSYYLLYHYVTTRWSGIPYMGMMFGCVRICDSRTGPATSTTIGGKPFVRDGDLLKTPNLLSSCAFSVLCLARCRPARAPRCTLSPNSS
eukprot:5255826-Pyramimonas_sp.AAC.1